jgi:transketolase
MKLNPEHPRWFDRDRFILSAGHGSAILYSLLHLTGYELSINDLKSFRQWDSKTPGHPERGLTPGVEVTTGPLGQGFANGVGLAIAEKYLAANYNRPGHEIIDHYTFSIVSDGDLMEGVSSEAGSLAGHLRLGKLIYLYDANRVSLSAGTNITFTEHIGRRFEAFGWHVRNVKDGNDLASIDTALKSAKDEKDRPSLIIVNTHIGYGSPRQDSYKAHGEPLGEENVRKTKQFFGWPEEPTFYEPIEALEHFRGAMIRGKKGEEEWERKFVRYEKDFPKEAADLRRYRNGEFAGGWEKDIPSFPADAKGMATRIASGQVMNAIAPHMPELIGGSADLNPSTFTALKGMGDFEPPADEITDDQGSAGGGWNYAGRNLHFGVREHAMGGILNGIAAHGGLIPYGATFLIFSDYMRPPLRLAALSGLQVIYVFTHDSIGLGQDGPTHQPVEQIPGLRAIPNFTMIRPCDANETAQAWIAALRNRKAPTALVLTRQNVPTLDRKKYTPANNLKKGAYILRDSPGDRPELILIATGSEVQLIVKAQDELEEKGIRVRTVSMPSWELFEKQPREYRESVFPPEIKKRISVEAASPEGWHRYVGCEGDIIAVVNFGHSAPGQEVMEHYGFTVENVVQRALKLLGK